jgi:Holliday junction DNA helicase RuvA
MIGRLSGRVEWRGADRVLIDVGGVGYVVHVSDRTLAALPGTGGHAVLYTDLLVREDLLQLFGFATLQEKELHRLLTSVQGIGARASQAILGALGAEGVSRAIALGDWAAVKAAPGVGPKLAQRVVHELQGRAAEVMAMGSASVGEGARPAGADAAPGAGGAAPSPEPGAAPSPEPGAAAQAAPAAAASAQADALSALTNLGYARSEAAAAIARAAAEAAESSGGEPAAGDLIRAALKLLAPTG